MARELAEKTSDESEGTSSDARRTDAETERETPDKGLLNRREYLKLGAAAAATATGAAAATGTVAAASHRGISFDTVVDAVDDLGMDSNGNSAIDSKLSSAMSSNTLIEFPPGEYLVEDVHSESGLDNFGIRGTGDSPGDVKFVFPSGNNGNSDYVMLKLTGVNGLLLENFQLHQTDDKRTGASFIIYAEDNLEMHDVVWQGWNPVASYAKGTCCYPSITSGSGVGNITNVQIKGGGVAGDYPNRRMGFLMQGNHRGELVFKNLDIRELGSSALRGTKCPGAVKIEDSHFENNDNGSIRIGGGRDGESYAKRCTVLVDGSRVKHPVSGAGYKNMDGVRIDSSGGGWSGATIEDCEIIYREYPDGINRTRATISRPSFGDHAGFTVRNCNIQIDVPNCPAVKASSPGGSSTAPYDVVLDNVHITGKQSSNPEDAVVYIDNSDKSAVKNSCINVPSGSLNGVCIHDSSGCTVASSDIVVGGKATDFSGASVDTSGLTSDGACRIPGDKIPDSGGNDGTSDGSGDSGSDGSGGGSDLPNTLEIRGKGTATNYSLTVEGDLAGEKLESWDSVSGSSAEGWVTTSGQTDVFQFSGAVSEFTFKQGEAELTLNGQTLTAQELRNWAPDGSGDSGSDGSDGSGGDSGGSGDGSDGSGDGTDGSTGDSGSDGSSGGSSPSNTLEIRGKGTATNYSLTVEGDLAGEKLESWDSVSGSSAEGWVTTSSQTDVFQFSGAVSEFTFKQGEAELTLNGQTLTAQELRNWAPDGSGDSGSGGSGDALPRTLQVTGTGSEANYTILIDGELAGGSESDLEQRDSVSGTSAEGWVTSSGSDTYNFSGDVAYFGFLEGEAEVTIDGETVAADEVGYGNAITIEGYGSESATYEITASENIIPHPGLGDLEADATPGRSVEDSVTDGTHAFVYKGDLTNFSLSGDAAVYVDGEQVDPAALSELTVSPFPNLIVVDGTDAGSTEYEFAVSGSVVRSPDLGSAETSDSISGSQVAGAIDGDVDGYRFTGNLTAMKTSGSVSITFEDNDG